MTEIKKEDFLHLRFIRKNDEVDVRNIEGELKDSMDLFLKMLEKLERLKGEEAKQLLQKLRSLDREIHQALLEHFDGELEHCDCEDDEPEAASGDEKVLADLWKIKRLKLTRQELQAHGLKTPLGVMDLEIRIGEFRLLRTSIWRYTYRLERLSAMAA